MDDLEAAFAEVGREERLAGIRFFIHEMERTVQDRLRVYGPDDSELPFFRQQLARGKAAAELEPVFAALLPSEQQALQEASRTTQLPIDDLVGQILPWLQANSAVRQEVHNDLIAAALLVASWRRGEVSQFRKYVEEMQRRIGRPLSDRQAIAFAHLFLVQTDGR